jgi:hypothetical protein
VTVTVAPPDQGRRGGDGPGGGDGGGDGHGGGRPRNDRGMWLLLAAAALLVVTVLVVLTVVHPAGHGPVCVPMRGAPGLRLCAGGS